ncbi:MAG TPA: LamG-like jellyroll fold domain-containing protein, partial [Verrucomicrobiae bacterium]
MKNLVSATFRRAFRLSCVASILLSTARIDAGTVAWWRFENGPANSNVPHAGADGAFNGTTPDVSGNGNSLSAWTQGGYAGFAYRTNVPFAMLSLNGATNQFSVRNTGNYPAFFTSAAGSLPSGINAQTITPAQFTIEASYKPQANAGFRTIVGRDVINVSSGNASHAALYLQARPDDSVGITFTDVSGVTSSAFSPPGWLYGYDAGSNPEGTNVPWYNLAAVSDGTTLKMYVNSVLVAVTDLSTNSSPNRSLAKGTTSGADWTTGAWSVGRGLYAGGHTDRAYGFIDEVRISDSALTPNEFLAAARAKISNARMLAGNLTFNVIDGLPGTTCRVLRSSDASAPIADWISISTKTFDSNGTFGFTTPIQSATDQLFYRLETVIGPPVIGPLKYQLAGNAASWPADIRAQIIYAMDGAVAQYNRYGTFNKQLYVNYNPSVPTAQASYNGTIDFGGQIGYRTALHEIGHALGVGTIANWSANLQNGIW